MNRKRILALVLALALCLALCACGAEDEAKLETISIWYIEGEPGGAALVSLVQEYNESSEAAVLVSLRSFADEESLAAAFDLARPELLLCSHAKALDLFGRELCRNIGANLGEAPQYPEYLLERFAGVGSSFFPLGSQVSLLYARQGSLDENSLSHMEALLEQCADFGRQERLPFFTADSFAALFFDCLLSLDTQFHAQRDLELFDENYRRVYNLIAQAGYEGGLISSEYQGADLVRSGYIKCAAVDSTSLAGLSESGYVIAPLPQLEEGSARLADSFGLAVTARQERSLGSIVSFMRWILEPERLNSLALSAGLVPALSGASDDSGSALSEALMQVYEGAELYLPDYNSDYLKNRESFEDEFRRTLQYLQ